MTLSSGLTVNGNLILESDLDLNGQTIILGNSAVLVEDVGRLTGTSGTISATRALNTPDSENVAGFGAVLTSGSDMGEPSSHGEIRPCQVHWAFKEVSIATTKSPPPTTADSMPG